MNTANEIDRIHGAGAISLNALPTYALIIRDSAHQMSYCSLNHQQHFLSSHRWMINHSEP